MAVRRISVFLLILIVSVSSLWAINYQKTYQMTDEVWIRANRLCIETGHLGPAPVSPTSGAEILNALDRLDYSSLTPAQREEYDYLKAELGDSSESLAFSAKNITLDPAIRIGLEGYAFNNLKSTPVEEFFIPFRDRIPFFTAGLWSYFGDMAYLGLEVMYKDGWRGFDLNSNGEVIKGDYHYTFSNISFILSPAYGGGWSFLMSSQDKATGYGFLAFQPIKVGGSFGNEFMNFFIGRDRQAFGNGVTGNLVIGDNFSFQEIAKLSFFTDIFSYTLSMTHFDNIEDSTAFKLDGMHQNRLIHRFDINFLNKFRFALNIGAHMYTQSAFDLRMFNPMMIVHNWNNNREAIKWTPENGDEVNNIMGFEFEYAFLPSFLATAQVVIDQFRLPVEKNSTVPSAMGYLINLRHVKSFRTGTLESFIEAAYTTPYLYLNQKTLKGERMYALDHIVGYTFEGGSPVEEGYTGYIYGPDAVVLSLGSSYSSLKGWSVSGNVLYMMHGMHGRDDWRNKNNRDNINESTPTGTPEHTLAFTLDGSWQITKSLELTGGLYTSFKWNYHNQKDIFRSDVQAAVGLTWVII